MDRSNPPETRSRPPTRIIGAGGARASTYVASQSSVAILALDCSADSNCDQVEEESNHLGSGSKMCVTRCGIEQNENSRKNTAKYFIIRDLNKGEVELVGLEETDASNRETDTVVRESTEGLRRVKTQDGFNFRTEQFDVPEVVEGRKVVAICKDAFTKCFPSLKFLSISRFVRKIEPQTFARLELCSITVDDNNPVYASEDGVLFDKKKKILEYYPTQKGDELYVVPDGVEGIADHAFSSSRVFKVIIPQSVKEIGKSAFSYCHNLQSINIPEGVEELPDRVFAECKNLANIEIPASVIKIQESAFLSCKSLKTIKIQNGVRRIASKAFADCFALKKISIPKSVVEIAPYAFLNCIGIESYKVDENNPKYASEEGVLFDRGKTKLILYPQGKKDAIYNVPTSVVRIENFALMDCIFEKVYIPDSVTYIGRSAFESCSRLKEAVISPNVPNLLFATFQGCESLSRVTIPEGVKVIDCFVFYDCSQLQEVEIPSTLIDIDRTAFQKSPKLRSFQVATNNSRSENRGNSLYDKNTGHAIFDLIGAPHADDVETYEKLDNLRHTNIPQREKKYVKYAVSLLTHVLELLEHNPSDPLGMGGCLVEVKRKHREIIVVPDNVTTLDDHILDTVKIENRDKFLNDIRGIVISSSVTEIDFDFLLKLQDLIEIGVVKNNANFSSIDGVLFDKEKTTLLLCPKRLSHTIPEGVITVSNIAFDLCKSSLIRLNIPSSLLSINAHTLLKCENLKWIDVDHNNSTYETIGNSVVLKNTKTILCYPNGRTETEYTIPNGVQHIGYGAFRENKILKSVIIPEGIETICGDAFRYCENLEYVKIPKTVEMIEECAFSNCHNLKNLEISPENTSFASIDGVLFWKKPQFVLRQYSRGLRRTCYEIPDGVEEIYHYALNNRKGLKWVVIPGSVKKIGKRALFGCRDLEAVDIKDGVQIIDAYAFYQCDKLTHIEIPSSVKVVAEAAFQNCTSLEIVKFSEGIEYIGAFAFNMCGNLRDVYIPGTVKEICDRAFSFSPVKLHVPAGSYALEWAIDHEIAYVVE